MPAAGRPPRERKICALSWEFFVNVREESMKFELTIRQSRSPC